MLVAAVCLLPLSVLGAEPSRLRFEGCEASGLNTALTAGLFASSSHGLSTEPLEVVCHPDGTLLIRRGARSRQVSLADVEPGLRAQSLALLLVEVDSGRASSAPAAKRPRSAAPVAAPLTAAVPSSPDGTTLEVEGPAVAAVAEKPAAPAIRVAEPTVEPPAVEKVADAPVQTAPPSLVLAPRAATLEGPVRLPAAETERNLRIAGGFTLGLGVLFLACAITGSMLLAYAQNPEIRGAAYAMLGLSVAALVGTGVAFGVWLGERNR